MNETAYQIGQVLMLLVLASYITLIVEMTRSALTKIARAAAEANEVRPFDIQVGSKASITINGRVVTDLVVDQTRIDKDGITVLLRPARTYLRDWEA